MQCTAAAQSEMEHKRMSDRPTRLADAFEYLETIVGVEGLSLTEGGLLLKQQFLTRDAGWKGQIQQSLALPGSVSNPVAVWTRKAEESCKVRNRANDAPRLGKQCKIADGVDFREVTHRIAELWRTLWETSRRNVHLPCGKAVFALLCGAGSTLAAQTTASRLAQGIESNSAVELQGSLDPRAAARFDIGSIDPATRMSGITMHLSLTSEQKAELDAHSEISVTANSTTTTALTIYTSESDCSSDSSSVTKGRAHRFISRKALAAVPAGSPFSRRIAPVSAVAIADSFCSACEEREAHCGAS
jgi:hypothetical protein